MLFLRGASRFPAPGKLVEISPGHRLHIHVQGAGTPTVILESGLAASSLSWAFVQGPIGKFARVVSYDRAGLGWSDACRTPRTLESMISELAALLAKERIDPPYILVGHSFGGLLIRAFAHLRPGELAGLVFVDPVTLTGWAQPDETQLSRLQTGIRLSRRGALLARLGIVGAALAILSAGGARLPKLVARVSAAQGNSLLERLIGEVRKLPAETHHIMRAQWSRPRSFQAMAAYLECLPASAKLALDMPIPRVPFVILSAASATEDELRERDSWVERGSGFGRHAPVENTGHWLQLERPDVVVNAVSEMVDAGSH